MIDKDLAARLKSYRNFKHLTQKEVAKYLKVPHSAISDIENGKRDITVGELKIFSNLYGRSVEEIISGKKYDYYNRCETNACFAWRISYIRTCDAKDALV